MKNTILMAAVVAALPAVAQAGEPKVFTLGEVHVAAPADSELPGTDTLSQDQMRLLNRETLEDALNTMPGVSITHGGNQRNEANYYIRGMDRWRVPLYIDGIRVYLPADNRIDVARFTTADVAEIQVTKGYTSVINGPGAMGGSVNLVSRRVAKEVEGDLRQGVRFDGNGAFNGFTDEAFVGTAQDKWYVQGFGQFSQRDHYRLSEDFKPGPGENGGNRNESDTQDYKINLKAGYTPNAQDEYSINFIRQDGEKSAPPNATQTAAQNRYWRWPEWRKQSIYAIGKKTADDGSYIKVRGFFDWMENGIDFYDDYRYSSQNNTNFGVWSQYRDTAWGGSVEGGLNLLGGRDMLRVALHGRNDTHREQNMYNERNGGPAVPVARRLEPTQEVIEDTYSVAVENTFKATPDWDVIAGASYDMRLMSKAQDWATESVNGGVQNVNGRMIDYARNNLYAFNPQLATIYRYSMTGNVSASVEQRTRFPTIFERYSNRFGTGTGNANLMPERATSGQVQVKDQVGEVTKVGGSVFYSYISDAITSVNVVFPAPVGTVTQYQNIGKARHQGFEPGGVDAGAAQPGAGRQLHLPGRGNHHQAGAADRHSPAQGHPVRRLGGAVRLPRGALGGTVLGALDPGGHLDRLLPRWRQRGGQPQARLQTAGGPDRRGRRQEYFRRRLRHHRRLSRGGGATTSPMSASLSDGALAMAGYGGPPWWRSAAGSLAVHGLAVLAVGLFSVQQASVPEEPPPPPPVVLLELSAPAVAAAGASAAPAAVEASKPVAAPVAVPSAKPVPARRPVKLSPQPGPMPVPAIQPSSSSGEAASAGPVSAPAEVPGSGGGVAAGDGLGGRGQGVSAGVEGSAQPGDAIAAYLADVRARLQRGLIYPPKARRVGLQGAVRVRLRVLADGRVAPESVAVVGDDAHPLLAAGAVETVRAVPLKPPPLPEMELVAPLTFRIE
ncbi:MAG: TonB-dependent receptor [Magnetospirillum sp.]|nr:TonB-dependent receptor [Magnetospirillum sp.]